uniref:Myosin motor domain-containing protein n=1 Tax=Mesocestoides corti TaxID=53468 RepID=A0A5K3ER39_MESCO
DLTHFELHLLINLCTFLSQNTHDVKLEELRENVINSSAVLIQSRWRGAMARSRYKSLRKSTIFCQRRFRQLAARRRFLRFQSVKFIIIRMQANVRAKQVRKRYVAQKYFILRLQSLARCWLSKQSLYSLMRTKGYFAADMINHCDEHTKVYTCETDLIEDVLLRNPMYATWSCAPLPENTAHMTGLATNVPEKCEIRQFSVSLESKILSPTKVAHSQAFSDLDSLVDAIFDGVFDSVNPAKRGQSDKNTTAGGSIQIKEDRCLNPTDSVAVNESLDEAMTGELSAVPGTGVGVGSKRFKARCPVLLSPPHSNDGVELTHASAGQHTLCAPGSTTGFSEAGSEYEQSMGASTALEDHSTQSECSFFKFAAAYFQTGSSATYTSSRLNRPLFKHRNQHDQSLALDIFSKIMSFMKPKNAADEGKLESTTTMMNEGRSGATDVSGTSTWAPHSSSKRPRVVLSSTNGSTHDIPLTDDSDSVVGNGQSTYTTTVKIRRDSQAVLLSELCKVRFIVGAGIDHPQMRDEIYCQILKQITKNPCVYSRTRGWILLILCASCFPPIHFDSALKSYLKSNPSTYSKTCLKRLSRIYQTGVRSKPPSYMELKAAEERKSLIVNILCADNGRIKVKVDPTVTVQELSSMAFSAASIKDTFGFEIFINIFDKSYALAMGPNHLFDTISFCEEHAKKNGVRESDLPWSFIIRKTIFAPWHDVTFDPVATSLICYQVTQQCFTEAHETLEEHELAYLMANIYRLLHADMLEVKSSNLSPDSGHLDLHSWLTQILSPGCDISYWQKVMSTALHELHTRSPDATIGATCQNIVTFAKLQWPSIFAREFETIFLQGNCRVQQVLLCVDCYGIQLLSEKRALLNSFPFVEIYTVSVSSATQQPMKVISVKTIWMKEYRFLSSRAAELMDLLTYMLTGLRQRSRYAIAIKNSPQGECRGKSMIRVNAGDYLILHQLGWELDQKTPLIGYPTPCKSAHFIPQKDTDTSISCYGENQRTWETGYVPMTSIYILPSVNPPKPEFIDALSYQIISSENKHWLNMVDDINSQRSRPPATYFQRRPASQNDAALSHNGFFAVDDLTENCSHRPVSQFSDLEASSKTIATYGDSTATEKQISLKHTRLPLKKPFLREVASADRKILDAALFSFCIIQTYMGDCEKIPPQLKNMPPVFLTDLLFGSALDCPLLRDEVFIQIMNQLTGNPKRTSESKGLELLWLATGIMVPSEKIMNKLVSFLHRSPHLLASQCYVRLHHTLSRGMRKKPPHTLEVAAIRGKKPKILQKIILPNEVSLMATLESTTRAADVVRDVVRRFCLASVEHFALYIEVDGELRCIKPEEFVLDALRLTMPEIPQQISLKRHMTFPPPSSLYFMRKLWLNFIPGQDPIEDRQINFPQAMKNFLSGYYQCSPEQALELSTLIFIWHSEEFPNSQISLNKLLPKNMLSNVTEAQWISKLTAVVNANRRLSRNDIPANFLACLSKVSTFGSSFFHVMPNSSTDTCLMIVNSSSVSLVDDKKGIYEGERCRYSVKDIAECWQDNQIINFQLRKTSSVNKWVSSVTTAHNACDLINCYLRCEKPNSLKP